MSSDKFFEVKDLVVEYTSGGNVIHAVNGVSLSVEKGKTLALVGETGAGKTTIAKSVMRILPNPPAKIRSGEVWFEGEDLQKISESNMRKIRGRKISMVFQDPMTALNPVMTIGAQIAEVIKLHDRVSKHEAKKRAIEMLEMVGITGERYNEFPHQFSGGMKQRVVIAMALACNPQILLADEPTSALDVTIQAQVMEMINKLRKQYQTAMILITHDFGIVSSAAENVAVIYAGEIVEQGLTEQVLQRPSHPYTQGLLGAIPDIAVEVERLANIMGMPPDPSNLPEGCCFSPRCPYAADQCRAAKPELTDTGGAHLCRCFKSAEIAKEAQHG